MDQINLGEIRITLRHVRERNEDVYSIGVEAFCALGSRQALADLLTTGIGRPERFVIQEDERGPVVSTTHPDAIIALALALNQAQGTEVKEHETETLRDLFGRLRQQTR